MPYVSARNSRTAATTGGLVAAGRRRARRCSRARSRPSPPGVIGSAESSRPNAKTAKTSAAVDLLLGDADVPQREQQHEEQGELAEHRGRA